MGALPPQMQMEEEEVAAPGEARVARQRPSGPALDIKNLSPATWPLSGRWYVYPYVYIWHSPGHPHPPPPGDGHGSLPRPLWEWVGWLWMGGNAG